jgi:rare lipoprotein A
MTAASNTLPYGTMVHVVNTSNGKSVDVKVVDHGIQGSAIIDLADEAFQKIAPLGQGVVQVRLEKP